MRQFLKKIAFISVIVTLCVCTYAQEAVPPIEEESQIQLTPEEKYDMGVKYMYAVDDDVEQDINKALDYFAQSAEAGDATALFNLAMDYLRGKDVEQNIDLARKYFKESLLAGYIPEECLYGYAKTFTNFHSDKEEALQSLKWYKKAAALAHPLSLATVAGYYEQGYGVEVDPEEAYKWYKKAYETGDPQIRYFLKEQGMVFEN